MSIKTRVRPTSETFMDDPEVQDQRHRDRLIHEVVIQLDVPTLVSPVSSDLFRFHFVCCVDKVSDLINHSVVSLLVVYYESRKREVKARPIYECRCDERLKTKSEKSTRLGYTGLFGELEHLKIETRLRDEMFDSVMGEYGFLK